MGIESSNNNGSSPDFSDFNKGATRKSPPPELNKGRDANNGKSALMPEKSGVLKGLTSGLGKATGVVANLFKKHPMKATGLCIAVGAAALVAGVALAGGPAGLIIAGALIAGGGIGLAVAGLFLEPGKGLYTKSDTRENQIMNRANESSATDELPSLNTPSNGRGVPNEPGIEGTEEETNERSIPTDSSQVMNRLISGGGRFTQWAGDAIANISERWKRDASEGASSTSERNSSRSQNESVDELDSAKEPSQYDGSMSDYKKEKMQKYTYEGRDSQDNLPPLPPTPGSQGTNM